MTIEHFFPTATKREDGSYTYVVPLYLYQGQSASFVSTRDHRTGIGPATAKESCVYISKTVATFFLDPTFVLSALDSELDHLANKRAALIKVYNEQLAAVNNQYLRLVEKRKGVGVEVAN